VQKREEGRETIVTVRGIKCVEIGGLEGSCSKYKVMSKDFPQAPESIFKFTESVI